MLIKMPQKEYKKRKRQEKKETPRKRPRTTSKASPVTPSEPVAKIPASGELSIGLQESESRPSNAFDDVVVSGEADDDDTNNHQNQDTQDTAPSFSQVNSPAPDLDEMEL